VLQSTTQKRGSYLVVPYLTFFLLLSVWSVMQPQYTWDLLGYIGSSVDSTDAKAIHRAVFDVIRPISSSPDIQVDNPYRADVAANPYHFAEQLPFYSIKPVYVALVKLTHRAGLPFPKAAVSISAAANFILAALLWLWLGSYLGGWSLLASCTLIMLSPNILALSRWATPDCLATAVAAIALYLILERNLAFWGSALLIVNVWIRTDALVLAGIVFATLLLLRKLDALQFVSLSILALASYFTINHFSGSYGWAVLFYNSFFGGVPAPGEAVLHVSSRAYLHQLVRGSFLWLVYGSFALYLLLGALAIWLRKSTNYSYMIAAVLAARVVSYALYPNGDQRYTAVLYVLVLVSLVIAIRQSVSVSDSQPAAAFANAPARAEKGWSSKFALRLNHRDNSATS
jgi:hypothetical protein